MTGFLQRLRRDDKGVTALEYALIAGLIAIVIIAALTKVGTSLSKEFTTIAGTV